MEQINFRIDPEEKKILQFIAEDRSITITELARQAVLNEIKQKRIDLAFKLLIEGKIGRKRAWKLSGLTYHEFLVEWTNRGAVECISEDIIDKELEIINNLDINKQTK